MSMFLLSGFGLQSSPGNKIFVGVVHEPPLLKEVIKMIITIAPFTINTSCKYPALLIEQEKEELTQRCHLQITYWGIFLDDKHISYTSSKELAEKTKVWMEKWLKDRLET